MYYYHCKEEKYVIIFIKKQVYSRGRKKELSKVLTIGITSYNNSPFLKELIYEIDNQIKTDENLLKKIEFFLVDDCSDDLEMYNIFKEVPLYIKKVKNEVNSGSPARGRNYIIDNSKAEYVLFLDGDDTLLSKMRDIVKELEGENTDIFISDVIKLNNDGIESPSPFIFSKEIFNEGNIKDLEKKVVHQTGIWSIYSVIFLRNNNIYYRENLRYEDNLFMTELYLANPVIKLLKTKYYGWRNNYTSFSYSGSHVESRIIIYEKIVHLLLKNQKHPMAPWLYYSIWNQTYQNIIRGYPELDKKTTIHYYEELEKITKGNKELIDTFFSKLDNKVISAYGRIRKIIKKDQFWLLMILKKAKLYFDNKGIIKHSILKLFYMLPINDKKIFITSHYGEYNDNPKYFYLMMKEDYRYKDFKFVFGVKDRKMSKEKDFFNYNNKILFYYHHYTAKEIYFNSWYNPHIGKRGEQIWIQLWHGIPYKKIHTDIPVYSKVFSPNKQKERLKSIRKWDVVHSVNMYNTKIFKDLFPCTDVKEGEYSKVKWLLKNINNKELVNQIQKKYKIKKNTILYAPTYRPYKFYIDLKIVCDYVDWEKDESLVIHLHPLMKYEFRNEELLIEKEIEILTEVNDIQEIILSTEKVLTDYSSIRYDYEKMGKKVLLFEPDKDLYSFIQGLY